MSGFDPQGLGWAGNREAYKVIIKEHVKLRLNRVPYPDIKPFRTSFINDQHYWSLRCPLE
jgi:hypothetical protein